MLQNTSIDRSVLDLFVPVPHVEFIVLITLDEPHVLIRDSTGGWLAHPLLFLMSALTRGINLDLLAAHRDGQSAGAISCCPGPQLTWIWI